jgi:hypothetical protein
MTEPTAQQMLAGVADSMVDIAIRGDMLNEDLFRRIAMDVEKDGVTYQVVITTADAESRWEQSLSTDDKVSLMLHKLGHHTDMIQLIGMSGTQTHHLVHDILETVKADD